MSQFCSSSLSRQLFYHRNGSVTFSPSYYVLFNTVSLSPDLVTRVLRSTQCRDGPLHCLNLVRTIQPYRRHSTVRLFNVQTNLDTVRCFEYFLDQWITGLYRMKLNLGPLTANCTQFSGSIISQVIVYGMCLSTKSFVSHIGWLPNFITWLFAPSDIMWLACLMAWLPQSGWYV